MNKIFRDVLLCVNILCLLFVSGCRNFSSEGIKREYEREELVEIEKADSKVEMIFTYAENQSDTYPTTQGAEKFAELVKERTDGRIEIVVKSGGSLGSERSVIEQLTFGGVDFARVSLAVLAEEIPNLGIFAMPFFYEDKAHQWMVLDGEIGQEALRYIGTTRSNMVGLSWYDSGIRHFYTSEKPIKTIEDLRGMKIRVQDSELMQAVVSAFGAIPVVMDYDEVYQGFQLDDIQGAENNWPSYESEKHYKVAKYMTETGHSRIPDIQLCSKNVWKKLSSVDREIIMACAYESAKFERQLWKQRERSAKERTTRSGVEVIEISEEERDKFKSAVEPLYEQLIEDYQEIVDEIKAIGNEDIHK